MYDESRYSFDRDGKVHEATIEAGAILYRLTSMQFSQKDDILTGMAPLVTRSSGRFHEPDQLVTYCANNVVICLAEVLYHMYRLVLNGIRDRQDYARVKGAMRWKKCLAVFVVDSITDLIYVDCEAVRADFDSRIAGTTVVFPDASYKPFRDFNADVRTRGKQGILYPSARHSRDLCVAIFGDARPKMRNDFFKCVPVELRLVHEAQEPGTEPYECDPFRDKLHATMGHYAFTDLAALGETRNAGALHPKDLPSAGMVDFVRRRYSDYPHDAVIR